MTTIDIDASRAKRLKEATNQTHDRLDNSIMAHKPFESRDRYGSFRKCSISFIAKSTRFMTMPFSTGCCLTLQDAAVSG